MPGIIKGLTQKEIDALGPSARKQLELMNVDNLPKKPPMPFMVIEKTEKPDDEMEFLIFSLACLSPGSYKQAQEALDKVIEQQSYKPEIERKLRMIEASLISLKKKIR